MRGSYQVQPTRLEAEELFQSPEGWRAAIRLGWGPVTARTDFRALWSAEALLLRFDVRDPSPWFTFEERDAPLWDEEVVEIFLDLDGSGTNYAEVELSPANVVCDLRMLRGSPNRQMDLDWNLTGLASRVLERGDGWTGLLSLPWTGFASLPSARGLSLPPQPSDRWRFNVYRIERPGGAKAPRDGVLFAAYAPTGDASFHVPAVFHDLIFLGEGAGRE